MYQQKKEIKKYIAIEKDKERHVAIEERDRERHASIEDRVLKNMPVAIEKIYRELTECMKYYNVNGPP